MACEALCTAPLRSEVDVTGPIQQLPVSDEMGTKCIITGKCTCTEICVYVVFKSLDKQINGPRDKHVHTHTRGHTHAHTHTHTHTHTHLLLGSLNKLSI